MIWFFPFSKEITKNAVRSEGWVVFSPTAPAEHCLGADFERNAAKWTVKDRCITPLGVRRWCNTAEIEKKKICSNHLR